MKKELIIIFSVFALTILAGLIYTAIIAKTTPESATITIPFVFIAVTGLAIFSECIIFALIFYKHLPTIWTNILPVFLITAIVPMYFISNWYDDLPVKVPSAGKLPVSIIQYQADIKLVLDHYLKTDLDSNRIDIYQDTIQSAQIDTIIYSINQTKFFAIIIAVAQDCNKLKYCANYRVGRRISNTCELGIPKGNIWTACFLSITEFKNSIRQYYYKRYSINNSSNLPEIWKDKYIFNF